MIVLLALVLLETLLLCLSVSLSDFLELKIMQSEIITTARYRDSISASIEIHITLKKLHVACKYK